MWFKVDDTFYAHPKAAGLSNDSLATWERAGNWSGWQLTDGEVPRSMLPQLAGNASDPWGVAADLVDRRLWEVIDGGWVFHDWTDYNPSRKEVLAKREQDRERRRRYLERRRNPANGQAGRVTPASESHQTLDAGVTRDTTRDRTRDTTRDATIDAGESLDAETVTRDRTRDGTRDSLVGHGVGHTSPTRPDPIGSESVQVGDQSSDHRNAGEADDLDRLIQALMFSKTGTSVDLDHAAAIRRQLLAGRTIDNPAAYIRRAIGTKQDARKLLPTRDHPTGGHPQAREIIDATRRPGGPSRDVQHWAQIARKGLNVTDTTDQPKPDPETTDPEVVEAEIVDDDERQDDETTDPEPGEGDNLTDDPWADPGDGDEIPF